LSDDVIYRVREAAAHSDLVRAVASIRRDGGRFYALGDAPLRPLYRDEIVQLEQRGNFCNDWSRVRVVDGFDWRKLANCSLQGDVLIGRFSSQVRLFEGLELPTGIYNATLANCVVANDVLIRDVKLLANYVVCNGAVLLNCGVITCAARTTFGNGISLPIGIESGGRDVAVYAEIDLAVATAVAKSRSQQEFLDGYTHAVADYAAQVTADRGIIAAGAVVRSTTTVRNTFLGAHALLDGATLIADSTVLSNPDEPTRIESGGCISEAILQWGSRVTTMAIVERSVLLEHAHAESHGKVANSILGPNSGVSQGEVTACLIGPFVSFHHQALLIATVWPEGKGNVGHGANIGSNHTSKTPDQEFWPGEGAFLGLGVNVKFPADFRRAPYSVLASGITTLPQRIEFPFSLLNAPSAHYPGVSPAYNGLIPAWVLTDNLYAVKRNEGKYRARNHARRQQFDFEVFRPDIADLMRDACKQLEAVRQIQEVYTDRDIQGLGKNFVLESNRQRALTVYKFFIRYYALLTLKNQVQTLRATGGEERLCQLLATPSSEPRWEHARRILSEELDVNDIAAGLQQLYETLEQIAHDVERSKAKDDERGPRIIEDYSDVHVAAAQDSFVRQTWEETRRLQREIAETLEWLAKWRASQRVQTCAQTGVERMIA